MTPPTATERAAVVPAEERRRGLLRLFTRRPQAEPLPQPRGWLRCSARDCDADTAVACAFSDRRLRRCATAWCPDHQSIVSGKVYCRRHAGIAHQIAVDSAEVFLPDVDDRAAGLCVWLAAELDGAVHAMLADLVEPGVDALLVSPVRPVFRGPARERSWEHGWKLASRTGIVVMVTVEVSERRSDEVVLRVNRQEVARAVPPWITARRGETASGDDAATRAAFRAGLVTAVAAAARAQAATARPR